MAERKTWSYRRLVLLAIALFLALAVAVIVLDHKQVSEIVDQANWYLVLPALFFAGLSYLFLSSMFLVITRIFLISMSWTDVLRISFISIVLGRVISFAGIPEYSLRALLMKERGVSISDVLATSAFYSYVSGLAIFGMFPVGVAYLLLTHSISVGSAAGLATSIAVAVAGMGLATVMIFSESKRIVVLRSISKLARKIAHRNLDDLIAVFDASLARATGTTRKRPILPAILLALIVGNWAATVATLHFTFDALGTSVGPGVLITGFAVGITAGTLSFLPGGIGVQDASMAGIFAVFGVPFGQGILAAALFRVVYYFIPFVVSLGFYRKLLAKD